MQLNKTRIALALATLTLAACGSGNSSSGGSSSPGTTTPVTNPAAVAGPLDPAQNAVSTQVFTPLVEATAGTPLQSVLLCTNSIVTRNTLDIGDAIASNLTSPSTLSSTAPADAQAALTALVGNLSGLLSSLASGQTTCAGGSSGTTPVPTTNPLAGTPLAALGDVLLPALTSASQQLSAGGGAPPQLSATQLSTLVGQLNDAFASGLAQLPAGTTDAPIVGGALVTIGDSLANLDALTTLVGTNGSPTAVAGSFQTLVQSALNDLLTLTVPAGDLQGAAGSGAPDVVGMIQSAVTTLTGSLGTSPTTTLPTNPLGSPDFSALTSLVNQLSTTLPTGGLPTTGTPLDAATGQLTTLINSLFPPPAPGGTGTGTGSTCLLGILCLG